ncbi:OHCU decarboxylase [Streptomyces cinnamoneus]|uniref:2-oxo-4-hydroxy-4-carboxy-5-ureidoimidazoline decarboxylase n=1 Tax=Streptomyces cinnamoneus TaxID=53446 RepID=A0A2G1XA32_STRCJ|nr:2-oxo-4-hydroxy-4-carboxy-5-ureidoimidazoline decarboxylase [Streptomyces cinnamoneus]PHQ48083.1 OHCU decarboxylase [Streptomyces cinnamoneus]PPT15709.1 OHCU decarboxylase [Streptomyces cinnamoneus]
MTASSTPGLARFNAAGGDEARAALHRICTSTAWAAEVLAHRPYPDAEALLAASDTAVARMGAADLAEAMAGHPPIGRPAPDDPVSAREQRGMADAPADLRARMRELNLAYQEKFGHVFLVCATGLTARQLYDAARNRLDNPPEREQEIVRGELAGINRIRLARLVVQTAEEGADRP